MSPELAAALAWAAITFTVASLGAIVIYNVIEHYASRRNPKGPTALVVIALLASIAINVVQIARMS